MRDMNLSSSSLKFEIQEQSKVHISEYMTFSAFNCIKIPDSPLNLHATSICTLVDVGEHNRIANDGIFMTHDIPV